MMNTKKLIYTAVATLLCAPSIFASPKAQAQMSQAIEKQIELLTQMEPLLNQVKDQSSAEKNAAQLQELAKAYQEAKMNEDLAENKLTELEEDSIEAKYDRQLDQLEDRVEDLAEKLYERKKGYGSDALLKALYPLCD